jgi:hypothetical protein
MQLPILLIMGYNLQCPEYNNGLNLQQSFVILNFLSKKKKIIFIFFLYYLHTKIHFLSF